MEYNQTTRDAKSAVITTIPFDFDDEQEPENALEDVKKLLEWANRHEYVPRLDYSGNKGFHVFIDIEPIKLMHVQETLRKFAFELKKAASFSTLDTSVTGDLNRMIRIPNTRHAKTNRYCIPIDIGMLPYLSMDDIEYMARQKSGYIQKRMPVADLVHEQLHEYDKQIDKIIEQNKQLQKPTINTEIFTGLQTEKVCYAYANTVKNGTSKGNRDAAIVGIIHKLKKSGKSYNEILKELKIFSNKCKPHLNEAYLVSKLNYHIKKDYSTCTFFSKICEECITCPHINHF